MSANCEQAKSADAGIEMRSPVCIMCRHSVIAKPRSICELTKMPFNADIYSGRKECPNRELKEEYTDEYTKD